MMPVVDATNSVVPVNSDLMLSFMINDFMGDVIMLSSEKIKSRQKNRTMRWGVK